MAEEQKHEEVPRESLIDKISEKIHGHDSSSSSDSEDEKKKSSPKKEGTPAEAPASFKDKIYRLFGREKPVHTVLGGGQPADIILWRNKKLSAGVLGSATAVWVLFELIEYHLLTLLCHCAIVTLALLFLWSNASTFIHKTPPRIPEVSIPEQPVLQLASALRIEINRAFAVLREIASGKELKKFLSVIAGLWFLSIVGGSLNFLTLTYLGTLFLFTVPAIYEKYDDKIDAIAEKGMVELKKQYVVFDEKVLSKVMSKIPRGLPKDKKKD